MVTVLLLLKVLSDPGTLLLGYSLTRVLSYRGTL